jgi:hypothetical protein
VGVASQRHFPHTRKFPSLLAYELYKQRYCKITLKNTLEESYGIMFMHQTRESSHMTVQCDLRT